MDGPAGIAFDRDLDARGLNCPLPILRTKRSLNEMQSGQVLKILATDPDVGTRLPGVLPADRPRAAGERCGQRRILLLLAQEVTADRLLIPLDRALRTLFARATSARAHPGDDLPEAEQSSAQRRETAALMRVNHVGEDLRASLVRGPDAGRARPAREGSAGARGKRGDRPPGLDPAQAGGAGRARSVLEPLFYAGSFALGAAAGLTGDRWNLGFLAETERQVEQHLERHLERLPPRTDAAAPSLAQMKADESGHAVDARAAQAAPTRAAPRARSAMTALASSVMTCDHGAGIRDSATLFELVRYVCCAVSSLASPDLEVVGDAARSCASMMEAEQYFSADRWMARSTWRAIDVAPGHDEVEVDRGEDLRVLRGALCIDLDHAVRNVLARLAQDGDDVVGGASCPSRRASFPSAAARDCAHPPRAPRPSGWRGCSRSGQEADLLHPFDAQFHGLLPAPRLAQACAVRQSGVAGSLQH